jgi:hypothetical protein
MRELFLGGKTSKVDKIKGPHKITASLALPQRGGQQLLMVGEEAN